MTQLFMATHEADGLAADYGHEGVDGDLIMRACMHCGRVQPRDEGEVVEPHDEFFSNWMCQRCAGLVAAEAEDDDPQMAYSLWCALGGNEYETIDYDEAGLALPGVRHGTLPYAGDDWVGDSQSDEEGSVRGEDEYYMSEL